MLLPGVPVRARGPRPEIKRLEGNSLGAKLRRRRVELGVFRKQAAAEMGVCPEALMKWERDVCEPQPYLYPKVIEYLGYEPWLAPQSLSEQLRAERLRRGLSIKRAAAALDVDESTFAGWEHGRRRPTEGSREICKRFLNS
jgi:transcriptional regulator with XRE-family HTH domain